MDSVGDKMIALTFAALVVATWCDWKKRIIPDWLTLPLIGVAVLYQLFFGNVLNSLLSGIFVFAILLGLAVVLKGGIGGGDIKLFTFLATALGFPMIGTLMMLSFLFAVLYGKLTSQKEIPLAPFILSSFVLLVVSDWITEIG